MENNILKSATLAISLIALVVALAAAIGAGGTVVSSSNIEPAKKAGDCNPMSRAGTTDSCLF